MKVLDLFCGAGGAWLGIKRACPGAMSIGVDIWETAIDSYMANNPLCEAICGDIHELDFSELTDVTTVWASPECTMHSTLRKGNWNMEHSDKSANLPFQVTRAVQALSPLEIVVENVEAFTKWERYDEWVQSISRQGYSYSTLSMCANHYGAATRRTRYIGIFTKYSFDVNLILEQQCDIRSCAKDILDQAFNNKATRMSERNTYTRNPITQDSIISYNSSPQNVSPITEPLYTITCNPKLAYVFNDNGVWKHRSLAECEYRLGQGFPEYYILCGNTQHERVKQIGNSVCPDVSQAIFNALNQARN